MGAMLRPKFPCPPRTHPLASRAMVALAPSIRHDATVAGLVGLAHFTSHFFQIAFTPLFPLMKEEFGASWTELGLIVTVFFVSSGICQAFAGIVVDRLGARGVLAAGIALLAGASALSAAATELWMIYPLAALAGVGNSVFHPADFSIMTSKIGHARLGRVYSVHAFLGTLGYAASPAAMGVLAHLTDWRTALLIAGAAGLVMAAIVSRAAHLTVKPMIAAHERSAEGAAIGYLQLLAMPAIMVGFAYFAFIAAAGIGLQSFSIPAFMEIYDVNPTDASNVLSAYLLASACGMLIGGVIADRTPQHHWVAAAGLVTAAVLMILLAAGHPEFWTAASLMAAAGLAVGMTGPSRDMLIKAATPPGSTGKVFGFVYSGLDLGALAGPMIFGVLMDAHMPFHIFTAVMVLQILGVFTAFKVRQASLAARAA